MKISRYCFDKTPMLDFAAVCARFSGKALQSPYRSTVPLLSLLEHGQPVWESLLVSLGAPNDSTAHLEYRVASPKPGGNPSHTDIMVISPSSVWAIEVKWTEPREAQSVSKRLSRPEADCADPTATVRGWLDYLQLFATKPLRIEDFAEVGYQMLHRAASACAVAAVSNQRPVLVYLHFEPSPLKTSSLTAYYGAELAQFHQLLGGPEGFEFKLVEISLQPTPAFESIRNLSKHAPETSRQVIQALGAGPLFKFGAPSIQSI